MLNLKKILLGWKPVYGVVQKSKRLVLPGFEGIPLYDAISFFFQEIKKDRLTDRAAAISFNFLLAIPPTCMFLFTLLPYIPLKNTESTIYQVLADITPNMSTYQIIHDVVYDFLNTQRTGLLSLAFFLGIFSSSNAVIGIMHSFDKGHITFRTRTAFQRRWMAIRLTLLLLLVVVVSLCLIIGQRAIFQYLFDWLGVTNTLFIFSVNLTRWLIIILLFFTIISAIYTYGPATQKRWKFITAGSTLATILIILTTLGFSYFVNHFNSYNRIYGSIGSILVLMLWIFLNSLVLLIGFELNASIEMVRATADRRIAAEEKERI
ncbi:YihY/virulence factor BrkB family protein [Compostibacter hankyongensis]|uniref:YihY/virulence factor BrkB family protein n=1 Tax=Compostibacter hankyongensis TaxID=1007089 RepID=A0ABP8FVV2_9BACT